jgi:hypothetical protein
LRVHVLEPAGRLGGAAAPIGSTCQHNWIGRAFIDVDKMIERSGRIMKKT